MLKKFSTRRSEILFCAEVETAGKIKIVAEPPRNKACPLSKRLAHDAELLIFVCCNEHNVLQQQCHYHRPSLKAHRSQTTIIFNWWYKQLARACTQSSETLPRPEFQGAFDFERCVGIALQLLRPFCCRAPATCFPTNEG